MPCSSDRNYIIFGGSFPHFFPQRNGASAAQAQKASPHTRRHFMARRRRKKQYPTNKLTNASNCGIVSRAARALSPLNKFNAAPLRDRSFYAGFR
jgi:hypothetical protein